MLNSKLKSLYLAISFVFIVLTVSVGYLLYIYTSESLHKGSNVSEVYESNILLKKLTEENFPKSLFKDLSEGKPRLAISKIDNTTRKVIEINQFTGEEKGLLQAIEIYRSDLQKLISLPKIENVLSVVKEKFNQFYLFSSKKNYRNLTRISKETIAYIKVPRNYEAETVNLLNSRLTKSIERMRELTIGSVLKPEAKAVIVTKLKGLSGELSFLTNYTKTLSSIESREKQISEEYKLWKLSVLPKLSLAKIKIDQNNERFFISFVSFAILLLVLGFGVAFYLRSWNKKFKTQEEEDLVQIIREGVLNGKDNFWKHLNEDTVKTLKQISQYINRRLNFSQVFQKAFPFPAILFDSNLNSIWANDFLCELIPLSNRQVKNEGISWDSMRRFTNLEETSPLHEALRGNISGIFQIQIFDFERKASSPYEMYVTPTEIHGEKRILVVFHSLANLQNTIKEQVQSLRQPITQCLSELRGEVSLDLFNEEKEGEFRSVGLEQVYTLLKDIIAKVEADRETQQDTIQDWKQSAESFSDQVQSQKIVSRNALMHLEEQEVTLRKIKESILNKMAFLEAGEHDLNKIYKENEKLVSEIVNFSETVKDLGLNHKKMDQALEKYPELRNATHTCFKENLDTVDMLREDFEKSCYHARRNQMSEFHSESEKVKKGIRDLIDQIKKTKSEVQKEEVLISKVGLLLRESSSTSLPDSSTRATSLPRSESFVDRITQEEQNSIELLKSLVHHLKSSKQYLAADYSGESIQVENSYYS